VAKLTPEKPSQIAQAAAARLMTQLARCLARSPPVILVAVDIGLIGGYLLKR